MASARSRCGRRRRVASVSTTALAAATAMAAALLPVLHAQRAAGERHVAAASGHICVVQAGGAVGCYGNASATDKLIPPAGVAFQAVTAGDDFSCGLSAINCSLRCWGALPGGAAQLPPPSTFFIDVHAGPRHVCGLVPNGTILCYGDATSRGAINVPRGVAFQGVSAGSDYTCGVARNHSVVCWGDGANPVVANAPMWRAITDAEHVAAGADHACYIRVNSSVGCWGSSSRGGTSPPAALAVNGVVRLLVAGGGMTCALLGTGVLGTATCWGTLNTLPGSNYELACAGWGCVASTYGSASCGGGAGRVCALGFAVAGGPPPPLGVSLRASGTAVVTTFVGNGTQGHVDGVGTAALFHTPAGVTLDGTGGLYVGEWGSNTIRRVDLASRMVTTVAGIAGTSGTTVGASPLQSTFDHPHRVAIDSTGNVYVADTYNHAIRLLSGVWVAGSMVGASGAADNATGTSATFQYPYVARPDLVEGKLYVADSWNQRVRTVSTAVNHAVATLAAFQSDVSDIVLNPTARTMYVAVNSAVFIVTYDGAKALLAGNEHDARHADGNATEARFDFLIGIAMDVSAGLLFVTEYSGQTIRRITTSAGDVTTLAGSGAAGLVDGVASAAAFHNPFGIALDGATQILYIGEEENNAIRQVHRLPPAAVAQAAAPLPPSPLAATDQLVAWRTLGSSGTLDCRAITFAAALSAANTAAMNPTISLLKLGSVALAPRDPAPAAAGNANTTFSTAAQRGLLSLSLATDAVPTSALALPGLKTLTVASRLPTQRLQLTAGSFAGLTALTCLNCGGVTGVANLAGAAAGTLLEAPLALPGITVVDAHNASVVGVEAHTFDGMPGLTLLSLADNTNLDFISDAAFSPAKHPALATLDQSGSALVDGTGCRAGSTDRVQLVPLGGQPFIACTACPAGSSCAGGVRRPVPCGCNSFAAGRAAACTPCAVGTFAPEAAAGCMACAPTLVATTCNATASWRNTIVIVTEGAGRWVGARILLVPAGARPADVNVSCGPLFAASSSLTCALPFLLPAAPPTVPLLAYVWVAHNGTGSVPQPLNATVWLSPQVVLSLAPGGGMGLAPQTRGSGHIVLQLPLPRPAAADWDAVGLPPPAQSTIDGLAVWVSGAPCTSPVWESSTTLSCGTTATDATEVAVTLQLAGGMFNLTGVLPALLRPSPALEVNVEAQLLPAPLMPGDGVINITLAGVALCAGGAPQLVSAAVAGVSCASIACVANNTDAALCVGWNASSDAASALRGGTQTSASVTAQWVNPAFRPVTCDACVTLASRPVLTSITPTSIAGAGTPVVLVGTALTGGARTRPSVSIGGETCVNVVLLSSAVVQCDAPAVPPSVPGFPVVAVEVVTAGGATSLESLNLTYPAPFNVSWASSPALSALPGGVLAPAVTLTVTSREAATCSLAVNAAACDSPNPAALASRPTGMTVSSPAAALAVGDSGSASAASTDLLLDALAVGGASGCSGTLTATCTDAVGQTASTAGLPGSPTVTLSSWRADWASPANASSPLVVVPGLLPDQDAVFELADDAASSGVSLLPALACTALLQLAAKPASPLSQALDSVSLRDVLSLATGVGQSANASHASIRFPGLTAQGAAMGEDLALHAECTWLPTGERVRLSPRAITTPLIRLEWVPDALETTVLLGYHQHSLHLVATLVRPANADDSGSGAPAAGVASCALTMLNATSRGASILADEWAVPLDAAAPAGTRLPMAVNVTLQAPPGTVVFLTAACSLWGQALAAPPRGVITSPLALTLVSQSPEHFIASDASSPWPLTPALAVAMSAVGTAEVVADVTCSATTTTLGADLKLAGGGAGGVSLQSMGAHPDTGVVAVPPFIVQVAPTAPNVTLVLACSRAAAGDTPPPPLTLVIPAVRLAMQLCTAPATHSAVSVALPPFVAGIVTTLPNGTVTSPCEGTTAAMTITLPPITCTVALNASGTTTPNTTAIFLQQAVVEVAGASHRATFDAFTVVAPPGEVYGLTLACAVGGLVIPPSHSFAVALQGCPAGQASESVKCVVCGTGSFSEGGIGARCTGCPPAGVSCDAGILSLLPHYFRPPAHAGTPIGPDTELHPCYNAEACTLEVGGNASGTAVYGCAYGYGGPLCGVCDGSVNYARFGETCAACWDPGASWFLLVLVLAVVAAVLARVALRKESSRSDASIVLRITLGYLQAVGSLRVFRAGGTKAYGSVMGWTEVVSASPLSVGALQCLLWLPYLFQYIAIVALPLLASAAVVAIFLAVTAGRSVRCKPRCGLDMVALKSTVAAWWASKRHLSTLLFVLFLAYMPIVSASLRALDCRPPIAGVRYLRSDLRVECGVGEHAAARALAYAVLVVIGVGFPAGLVWLVGTARAEQLVDPAFHATWGFLFDGYRTPSRTLSAAPLASTSSGVKGASHSGIRKLLGVRASLTTTTGTGAHGRQRRRRSVLVPERLTQAWVVAGDSRVWWEGVVLVRKAGVVLLAVTVTNPYLQCVGASLWFLAAFVLQVRFAPYSKRLFNRLETASLVATLLTAIISTTLLQYNVGVSAAELHPPDAMSGIEWTVTVALSLLNLGTFVVLAGMWLHLQCARVRTLVQNSTVASTLSARMSSRRLRLLSSSRCAVTGTGTGASSKVLAPPTQSSAESVLFAEDTATAAAPTGTGTPVNARRR